MTVSGEWEQVREQLKSEGPIDIIVGLPTCNDAATAKHVVTSLLAGLGKACPEAPALLVNADAGSQDGTPDLVRQAVEEGASGQPVHHAMVTLQPGVLASRAIEESGMPGRTQAFQTFLGVAGELDSKACVVVDANLRSVEPEWMDLLLRPVLDKNADYVSPLFQRPRYDGSLTNSILYPLSRALYGTRLRYQSGACGLSGKLAKASLGKGFWDDVHTRFGVDIALATLAVAEGHEVCQVFLGPKIYEGRRASGELSEVLAQAVGAVFHFMETYPEVWESKAGSTEPATYGPPFEPGTETVAINVERMLNGFRQGLRDLLPIWKVALPPETLSRILPLGLVDDEEFRFPAPLWVQTVYDFALAYHERGLHQEHLLKSLTPLYLGRTASLVLETRDGGSDEVERTIEALCQTFERMKPYLIDRWRFQ
jgi:hypothetical protein